MEPFEWKDTYGKTSLSFHKRVQETLKELPEKKEKAYMRKTKFTIKKAIVLSLAAALAIGTTVFATGKVTSITSSSNKQTEFHTLPTQNDVIKKCGFEAKYVTDFSNGYTFSVGNITNSNGYDDGKNKVASTKTLDLTYKNQNESVSLSVSKNVLEDDFSKMTATADLDGITLYYDSKNYKFEPANYKMTDQDKADEKAGKYVFSYGSDKEEISNFQSVSWVDNGNEYILMGQDSKLTQQDLITMAQQVVDVK